MDQHHKIPHPIAVEFMSLANALDYIDNILTNITEDPESDLPHTLTKLKSIYREFPELDVLRPRADLFAQVWAIAGNAAETISEALVIAFAGFAPAAALPSVIGKVCEHNDTRLLAKALSLAPAAQSGEPSVFIGLLNDLIKRHKNDLAIALLLHIPRWCGLDDQTDSFSLEDVLEQLLDARSTGQPAEAGLVATAESARRRLGPPAPGDDAGVTRDALLARAERLRSLIQPRGPTPPAKSGWPSATLRFDEFVLQWPCEVELADDLDDEAFVTATYRAVLLRAPLATEMQQWLRLLHRGDIHRAWLIEDLLASSERHAIRRQVRVIWRGRIIAAPGIIMADEMLPTVTLPIR